MAEKMRDARGRFTKAAVDMAAGVEIPLALLDELRMSASQMSRVVRKITSVANVNAEAAKAIIAHGLMREAAGEKKTMDELAAEAKEAFGDAKMAGAGGAMRIGLAGPAYTYGTAGAGGFDFNSFLRKAGKAASTAVDVSRGLAPLVATGAQTLGFDRAAQAASGVGRAADIASAVKSNPFGALSQLARPYAQQYAQLAQPYAQYGAGGLDLVNAGSFSQDLARLQGAGGAGGLIIGGAGGAGGLIIGGARGYERAGGLSVGGAGGAGGLVVGGAQKKSLQRKIGLQQKF